MLVLYRYLHICNSTFFKKETCRGFKLTPVMVVCTKSEPTFENPRIIRGFSQCTLEERICVLSTDFLDVHKESWCIPSIPSLFWFLSNQIADFFFIVGYLSVDQSLLYIFLVKKMDINTQNVTMSPLIRTTSQIWYGILLLDQHM